MLRRASNTVYPATQEKKTIVLQEETGLIKTYS